LKSKLYAIVFASFVVRVVAFFLLPNNPSHFAPDEGTYGKVASWLVNGSNDAEFSDYATKLYVSSRALLLPAKLFITAGMTPLDSVRATASIYAFLTGMLSLVSILMYENQLRKVFKSESFVLWLFSIFLFLPSHFIWSILGLRETATEFWVILTFAILNASLYLWQKHSIYLSAIFTFSIIMVYNSRPQVGTVLGVVIILFLIFICFLSNTDACMKYFSMKLSHVTFTKAEYNQRKPDNNISDYPFLVITDNKKYIKRDNEYCLFMTNDVHMLNFLNNNFLRLNFIHGNLLLSSKTKFIW
jgi:hypothetical protein